MSKLKKVLIVDDERLIRISIRKIGDWESLGAEVIGEARNGQEAYRMICSLLPEIIVTDMKMPGVDGIGLMNLLKRDFPQIKIIIISGYDDFAYMKSAIVHKAVDYILKPVNRDMMNAAIKKAIDEIDDAYAKHTDMAMKRIDTVFENRLILEKYFNEFFISKQMQKDQNIIPGTDILHRKDLHYIFVLFKFYNIACICKSRFSNNHEAINHDIYENIYEILGDTEGIAFKKQQSISEFCILLGYRMENKVDNNKFAITVAESLAIRLSTNLGLECLVGISSYYSTAEGIQSMYLEAKTAMFGINLFSDNRVAFYDNASLINGTNCKTIFDENIWSVAIESGDYYKVEKTLSDVLQNLSNLSSICLQDIENLYREIFHYTERSLVKLDIKMRAEDWIEEYVDEEHLSILFIESFEKRKFDFSKLHSMIMQRLTGYIDAVIIVKSQKSHPILFDVKSYIDMHFYEEISLRNLSLKFFISSGYLSRAFKNEFGQNITDYLINIRINKAREYMQNENLKITEIMHLTGFNNLNYFGKVFKKHFGITPSEGKCQNSSNV